ncbi:MAG: M1 family metallopeptidase, partial [Actinomycetota bacterium]
AGGSDTRGTLDGSLLSVAVPGGLAPGRQVLISFYFQARVPEITDELGLQTLLGGTPPGGYGIFGHADNIYNLGYPFPLVTRFENGEWDKRQVPPYGDPGDFDCAYFTVNIDVPDAFTVAASGLRTGVGGGSGRSTYKYTGGPMRDFSIQAGLDFRTTRVKEGETELTSYYSRDAGDASDKILEYARQSVRQFNKHFGPYPYRRLNICEAPLAGGAAGMEFAGQIFIGRTMYGDFGIELPKELEDLGGKETEDLFKELTGGLLGDAAEFTVAHEVCHQWWGMVVGSDPIDHAWQDEALTNYSSVMYFRWQHGAEDAKQQLESQLVSQYWAGSAMGAGDVVVDQPVADFGDQFTYTAAVYGKGALFFEALEQMLGEGVFEKDLKAYYEEYSFEVATPQDLLDAFKAKPSDPEAVAALFTRWLKEKHGSEDIVMSLPGGGVMKDLQDLMDQLPDMDLGPLEDWLKDLMDGGTTPEGQSAPPPSTSPVLPI